MAENESPKEPTRLQGAYSFYKVFLRIAAGIAILVTLIGVIAGFPAMVLIVAGSVCTTLLLIIMLAQAFLVNNEPVSSIGAWREGYISAKVNQNGPIQVEPSRDQTELLPQLRRPPTILDLIPNPRTLRDFFRVDFHNWSAFHQLITVQLKLQSEQGEILAEDEVKGCEVLLLIDHQSRAEFVALYVPDHPRVEEVCETFSDTYKTVVVDLIKKNVQADMYFLGEHPVGLSDLHFTGQVYIYHESPLTVEAKERIRAIYKQKKLSVMFRGGEHLQMQLARRASTNLFGQV